MTDPYREATEEEKTKEEKPAAPESALLSAPAKPKERLIDYEKLTAKEKTPEKQVESGAAIKTKESLPAPSVPPPSSKPLPKAGLIEADFINLDEDQKLKILIDLALEKSVDEAIKMAQATDNAHLVDKLHDTLKDEYYQQLLEKKKIKDV